MNLDVNPKKEIKGITIPILISIIVVVSGGVWMYSDLKSTVLVNRETTLDLKSALKEQQNSNEMQNRINSASLRELELRITRLEIELKK